MIIRSQKKEHRTVRRKSQHFCLKVIISNRIQILGKHDSHDRKDAKSNDRKYHKKATFTL